ncbi:HD domain-containing protein [Paractinoplanes atraurantiacus]|uniref:Histidine kinase-, DNA gyrase B-, and HSP90-like ATPase n=1 Tax=Paractinoplanes atraurantiacus TaxID=1036182 RepID=A0A285JKY2_9ACTN|nr:ATP-binding protein [Actinoplanes atraurantiacus]SNY60934.1 Histidine kinase-, DNA gyrase B-, and HSP90-like ATPase [Actinoplanes atraurantiacus]
MSGFAQSPYEATPLWRRTLAEIPDDPWHEQREKLRAAYRQFRETVAPLAGEIALSMPMFTDHSIAHIDALWDTASIICGDDFELNPAEAFVLGGAFLMHDLGMGLCAYPDGADEVTADRSYAGLLAVATDRIRRLEPSAEETSIAERARSEAIVELLRRRHADRAQELLRIPFTLSDGSTFHLLQDLSLRLDYGDMIGEIAASHWWDVERLHELDGPRSSRPDHPREWAVDKLKIACILRLADAAHIDSRRAPCHLYAFRHPTGVSAQHWEFQERLMRPDVQQDRLAYTSTRRFTGSEAPSWWLAYDIIKMIDTELRRVDALLADLGRPRFPVRSVAGADSPERLARYLRTDRWHPIDARIRVTDVGKVVGNLGGDKLYGKRPDIALRELVANASDATLARALREGTEPGTVTIKLAEIDDVWWLTVADEGIGMRREAMVSSLTDFGNSRWRSTDLLIEHPDLVGFEPTGRFGIGFFAVFMVADEVRVRSLALDEAPRDTHLLEFTGGLAVRPLLRTAEPDEWLRRAGTEVTARLREDPRSMNGLFRSGSRQLSHTEHLHALVRPLCALARVNIDVQGPDDARPVRVISADDWTSISETELFDRVYRRPDDSYKERAALDVYCKRFLERAQVLRDESGRVVGRAMMASVWEGAEGVGWYVFCESHIYVGGLQSATLAETMGVFSGNPLTADRLQAFPDIGTGRLTEWAESQAASFENMDTESRHILSGVARGLGAMAAGLPCGLTNSAALDVPAIHRWVGARDEIFLVSNVLFYVHFREGGRPWFMSRHHRELSLGDNCLFVSLYTRWLFPEEILPSPKDQAFADAQPAGDGWDARVWWYATGNFGSPGIVIRAISKEWGIAIPEVLDLMEPLHLEGDGDARPEVPVVGGGVERVEMIRLRRPGR